MREPVGSGSAAYDIATAPNSRSPRGVVTAVQWWPSSKETSRNTTAMACPSSSRSAPGVSSRGLRRPRLSTQSYEYGATAIWQSQRQVTSTGASTVIARVNSSTGPGTVVSAG
jgi:hypothetical protein